LISSTSTVVSRGVHSSNVYGWAVLAWKGPSSLRRFISQMKTPPSRLTPCFVISNQRPMQQRWNKQKRRRRAYTMVVIGMQSIRGCFCSVAPFWSEWQSKCPKMSPLSGQNVCVPGDVPGDISW
jgi:hypothetical protein